MELSHLINWARTRSLWYLEAGPGCCGDELMQAFGCRYDIERFGALRQTDPSQAELLIVVGAVSYKAATPLLELYSAMPSPKYVLAVGTCACSGGAFEAGCSYATVPGVDKIIPVDVYVAGCPPRPEAVLNGLIKLQEKIRGQERVHPKN